MSGAKEKKKIGLTTQIFIALILGAILGSHFALSKGGKFIRPMLLVVLVLLLGKMAMDLLG